MTSPDSRFYACEGLGFPPVTVYDYETNIAVRGVDNRDFRWEEVAVETIYQFKEATASGSFEDTNFAVSGMVNLISSNAQQNSTNFPGWVLTGSNTYLINLTGMIMTGGGLPIGYTPFQAHPLAGNYSIGMLALSGDNQPTITSVLLATGSQGPIIPEQTHQVYLIAKRNLGTTGSLSVTVRGWRNNAVVAYYDQFSGVWGVSESVHGHAISTGITTIKYNFTTSNFPAVTPTGYDIKVVSKTINSFITVDDIHIDAYMKRNAFIDNVIPSGYFVQLTPDLGWHDILSMFNSTEELTNPHLKTLGPYQIELANLVDNLDNSVTATLDQTDFLNATTDGFSRYLWRALPIGENGTVGQGGLPQRFQYVGNQLNDEFSIDKISDDDLSSIKTIIGKKSKRMLVSVDGNSSHPGMEYPTATTWRLTIPLQGPSRTLSIQAVDSGGARSSVRYITLSNKLYEQNSTALWNVFDEHGLVADVERLPGETNFDYSLRIKDSYKNKGGSSFVGIVNGATRELGLSKIHDGLTLSIIKDEFQNPKVSEVLVEVTAYSIRISSPSMYITERLLFDPIFRTVDATYLPREIPDFTLLADGSKIDQKDVSYVGQCNSAPSVYRFMIDADLEGTKFIELKYPYFHELLFKDYKTLEELVTALNEIREPNGQKTISAVLGSRLSGNELCLGLYVSNTRITPTQSAEIAWSPFYLKKMSDLGYRDYYITETTDLRSSEFYRFVKTIKNDTKVFWGNIEADRARWDAADSKDLAMDSVPTLFDPPLTELKSTLSGVSVRLEAVTAWARGYSGFNSEYLQNAGLTRDLFHPGVAHTEDLRPDIYLTSTRQLLSSSLTGNVGPIKNNNKIVIFSGQR